MSGEERMPKTKLKEPSYCFPYMEFKQNKTNKTKENKNRLTETGTKGMVTRRKGVRG